MSEMSYMSNHREVNMKAEEIANLFFDHEMLFHALYLRFETNFPLFSEFWRKMADDELRHAETMRWLSERFQKDEEIYKRIDAHALRRSLFYLKEQMALVDDIEPSHAAAVNIALDLEETFLEKNLFAVREEDPPDVREFFQEATLELKDHVRRLREEKQRIKMDRHVKG